MSIDDGRCDWCTEPISGKAFTDKTLYICESCADMTTRNAVHLRLANEVATLKDKVQALENDKARLEAELARLR